MLNYPKNFPMIGIIYPKIFINGTYQNRYIQPIKRIIGNFSKNITWVIRPKYDEYGTLYKHSYLQSAKKKYDIKIKYFDSGFDEVDSFTYENTYKSNVVFTERATRMIMVMSKIDGGYIGGLEDVWAYENRGIQDIQLGSNTQTCCIGFNPVEEKWYGWSHRAMCGFGVGDIVKEGDCCATSGYTEDYLKEHPEADTSLPIGFEAYVLEDAKKMAIAFAESVG